MTSPEPVSYTHLDVYKRQGNTEKAAELMTRATDEYQKMIAALKRCMFDK